MNVPQFKAVIVVPSIREKYLTEFLQVWQHEFANHHVIVVEDNPTNTFAVSAANVTHVSWANINNDLGDNAWIIPRRTDCVRSYGYLLAYRMRPDMIVTLDDDCYPYSPDYLQTHWERLTVGYVQGWVSSGTGLQPRGMPYFSQTAQRKAVVNHGLWTNIADYDAVTQLSRVRNGGEFIGTNQTIPIGSYYPMCGMNLAWLPEVTPAMYFLLMGQDYPYDRFGDIWSGLFVKRIADHLRVVVNSGVPYIEHKRASNVWMNLRKEATGLECNETLWDRIDKIELSSTDWATCYRELAEKFEPQSQYEEQMTKAMRIWSSLFIEST